MQIPQLFKKSNVAFQLIFESTFQLSEDCEGSKQSKTLYQLIIM